MPKRKYETKLERRHFIVIADILFNIRGRNFSTHKLSTEQEYDHLVYCIASELSHTNPEFDLAKFCKRAAKDNDSD